MPGKEPQTTTTVSTLRNRFRRRSEEPTAWDSPRRLLRFLRLAVGKAQDDKLIQQSASLAYITILSLIPLLATFSIIGTRAFSEQQDTMVRLLSQILPYSEQAILDSVREFLDHARTLRGASFAFFLVTALTAFMTIEETLNRIWNVPHTRPFRNRLLSFTLLLFWGPLVLGLTYSGLFYVGRQAAFEILAQSAAFQLAVQLVPYFVTLLALTMLYWLVPYATVYFRSAFLGGFLASALLEGLRRGFGLYIEKATSVSLVYGSLGLAIFFMISIQASWWIVLLGSETAYCTQHYDLLTRKRRHAAPLEGSWLALAALVVVAARFRRGEPTTSHELLAERLRLPAEDLVQVIRPMVEDGILREGGGTVDGYLLACDPHDLEISRVFELYEAWHWQVLELLPKSSAEELEHLRARLAEARAKGTAKLCLADLIPLPKTSKDDKDAAA